MDKGANNFRTSYICLALALATLTVYAQVYNFDFISYDDDMYVTENQYVRDGLTTDSIVWAFSTNHACNWHPLTWLSHMLDCQLFGAEPGWHHLINLLLHTVSTLLLFAVLKQMTGSLFKSAFVSFAFALHPLHVESVAWVAERKDVLSGLFWILTIAAYAQYTKRPTAGKYILLILTFALGLMAKPMLVTLPFVLLLLDYWPLGRFQIQQTSNAKLRSQRRTLYHLIWEKLPLLALSAISSVITFLVQQKCGAMKDVEDFSLTIRAANASVAYLMYIVKMIRPNRLAVFYPHLADKIPVWWVAVATLLLLGLSIWVIRLAPKHKFLMVGWFWYLGTLVPVIGLVQVGAQALADRYTYIPLTGLFIIAAWGAPVLMAKWRHCNIVLGISAPLVLLALSICTFFQLRYWQNTATIFEHALVVTQNNYVAHSSLASSLFSQGKLNQAVSYYSEALRIKPNYLWALKGMGYTLLAKGEPDQAIEYFTKAVQTHPDNPNTYNDLGLALKSQGKLDQAVNSYRQALQLKPDSPQIHYNLANVLLRQGKLEQAITHYTKAIQIKPDARIYNKLGYTLMQMGKLDQAAMQFNQALRLEPDSHDIHNNLGVILARLGKLDQAAEHFTEALRIKPDFAEARDNLNEVLDREKELNNITPP